jgi:flagellar hook-associated protein 1 FlgK
MSGFFSSLSATATALDAQTQAISVASNNIANINNPNYSRETVSYSSLGAVATTSGVQSTGISVSVEQMRSSVLDQMVRQEASLTSGFSAQQDILQQAQAALGESITNSSTSATANSSTTTDSGLESAINGFFGAVQNFAADPTDNGQRQALLQQAGVLTDRFQQIDQNLAQVQAGADSEATSGVASANTLLTDIAGLNTQIASVELNSPGSAVNLRDQREADLEQLAGLLPVTSVENAHGEVTVTTAAAATGGSPPVTGPVTLVSNGTATTVNYASGVLTTGSGSTLRTLTPASGSIQGDITAGTGAVQTLRGNLDALASQLVTSVNAAYNPLATSGHNFFDASGTAAATIALDSHLTNATLTAGVGAAGDNTIALAVAAVGSQVFATSGGSAIDGTISQFYANAVTGIGQAVDTANTRVTDQTNVQNIVTTQRNSLSGVSLNDEMTNLMSYQRAFQASSEVFNVINGLLDQLVNHLGQ